MQGVLFISSVFTVCIIGISSVNAQVPTPTQDPISPLITFLQQLQGLRQLYSGAGAGTGGRNLGNPFQIGLFSRPIDPNVSLTPSNSIDDSSPVSSPPVAPNRPSLANFLQSFRAGSLFDRLFRPNRNDQVTNSFAQSLLGLLFNRRNTNSLNLGNINNADVGANVN